MKPGFTHQFYTSALNLRMWSAENPLYFQETSQKIGVWCAIFRRRLFRPIFFDETDTAARYQHMLQGFIGPQNGNFQHDGVTAHTTQTRFNFLKEFCDERLISSQTNHHIYPPRSPDLIPFRLFLVPDLEKYHFKAIGEYN